MIQSNQRFFFGLMKIFRNCNSFIPFYKTPWKRLNEQMNFKIWIFLNSKLGLIMKKKLIANEKNLSTFNEITISIFNEMKNMKQWNLILTQKHSQKIHSLQNIHETHVMNMFLINSLLFTKNDHDWWWNFKLWNEKCKNKRLQQFYFYKFQLHYHHREKTLIFYGERFFQQYVMNIFAACEKIRLSWLDIY